MNTKTFLPRAACAGLFAALVAAAPLKADEWMKFGLGLHIVNPSGDLTNEKAVGVKAKMGLGLSAFGEMGLNANMALRGRLDYNVFGEGEKKESYRDYIDGYPVSMSESAKLNASATTVFADFIYSFDSHEKGFYAFVGLGLVAGKLDYDIKVTASAEGISPITESGSMSGSGSGLGISLGCGYNFNKNMGLELSWASANGVISEIKDKNGRRHTLENKDKISFNWLQVSFKYRF